MKRMNDTNSRWGLPRLLAIAGTAMILIVLGAVVSGGAGAAPGDADLSISKTDSPDPVVAGDNLTYTIKVDNPGALPATETKVTDNLPSDVDFVSATGGVCERANRTVTCDLGQVNAASTATVTIIIRTKKAGNLSNTASVASPEDVVLTNNSATATTTVSKKPAQPKKPKKPKRGTPSCGAPTITGTAGDDVITGTSRDDVIVTFTGNDQVFAGGGQRSDLLGGGRRSRRRPGRRGHDHRRRRSRPPDRWQVRRRAEGQERPGPAEGQGR